MSAAVVIPAEIGPLTYRLTFKFGVIRIFEREIGMPIAEAFPSGDELEADEGAAPKVTMTMDVLSALFWASLQPHHAMTREAADDLIDIAGMSTVAGWIGKGIGAYWGAGDTTTAKAAGDAPAGNAPKKVKSPRS